MNDPPINRNALRHELDMPFPLEEAHIGHFRDHGFVMIRDLLSAGVLDFYGAQLSAKVTELSTEHRPLQERDTYGKAFVQVTNIWTRCEVVKELVFSPRLARLAAELMGVSGARLYHDQALYKEPGGGPTPWHVDQFYWPLATEKTCTVWIPLQDTPLAMGPAAFCKGSHRSDLGRDMEIGDLSERSIGRQILEAGFELVEEPFVLGEVSYHSGWTCHRSGANTTESMRRAMTIIYMDRDMVMAPPRNRFQQADHRAWLPGCHPGEVIDSPLNPVLWDRAEP